MPWGRVVPGKHWVLIRRPGSARLEAGLNLHAQFYLQSIADRGEDLKVVSYICSLKHLSPRMEGDGLPYIHPLTSTVQVIVEGTESNLKS